MEKVLTPPQPPKGAILGKTHCWSCWDPKAAHPANGCGGCFS